MTFWEKITDGIHLWELTLLGLGVIFFLAMLVVLVYRSMHDKPIKYNLYSFSIPVIMLVWPSINILRWNKDGIELSKELKVLDQSDSFDNNEKIQSLLTNIQSREIKDTSTLTNVAEANYHIGNDSVALSVIQKLDQMNVKNQKVLSIKASINTKRNLEDQLKKVNASPTDTIQVKKLIELRTYAKQLPEKNKEFIKKIDDAKTKIEVSSKSIDSIKNISESKQLKKARHIEK